VKGGRRKILGESRERGEILPPLFLGKGGWWKKGRKGKWDAAPYICYTSFGRG